MRRTRPSRWAALAVLSRWMWRRRAAHLGAGMALACATVLAGVGLLALSGWFITATAVAGLASGSALAFDVFSPSAGIRLLALGRTGLRYGERLVTHDATLALLAGLRESLFRGWARPEAARQLLARPARLLFRLTADIDALDAWYLRVLLPAATLCVTALAAGLALAFIDFWWALALTVWLVAAGIGIAALLAARARGPARLRAQGLEALRARSIDLVAGQTELAMVNRLDAQCAALKAADDRLAQADAGLNRLEAGAGAAYGLVSTLALSAALCVAALLVERGAIGVPVAAFVLFVVLASAEPFATLRRGALDIGRAALAARRIAPLMADTQAPAKTDASVTAAGAARQAAAAEAGGWALRFASVSASQAGTATPALLHRIDVGLRLGERVALIGPSGSGKSTLLALAAGELSPLSGFLYARDACLLTQRTELFQDSLRDNLSLACGRAADGAGDEPLWQALEAAGLASFVRALPQGLDTMLGEGGLGLSGGQARRLALARLLLRRAPLWLLDEPTEGVDPDTARDVLQRLARQAHEGEGHTLLLATHLRREALLAERLWVLRAGSIVADVRRGESEFDRLLLTLRPD